MKKQAIILGGLYFDKANGNTYHNAKIIILESENGTTYQTTYYTGYKYGYEKAYLTTAKDYINNVLHINDFEIVDCGSFSLTQKRVKNNQF